MEVTIKLELSKLSLILRSRLAKELKDAKFLTLLAKDEDERIRHAVAENSSTLKSDLSELVVDEDEDVRKAAIKMLITREAE